MTEQVREICDALTVRIRETVPAILDELIGAALQKMRVDFERELVGQKRAMLAAIETTKETKTELFEVLDLVCGIEGTLRKVAAAAAALSEQTDEIASRASDADYSLRKAGATLGELSESTETIASHASDAEYSLRKAVSWAIDLDERRRGRSPR